MKNPIGALQSKTDFLRHYDPSRNGQISPNIFPRHFDNSPSIIQITLCFINSATRNVEFEKMGKI
jgi:hypothetical protein